MIEITKDVVVKSILYQKEHLSADIKFTPELQKVLYRCLYAWYVDNKKYVLLQAPTGTGKSIIGFLLSYCIDYIEEYIKLEYAAQLRKEHDGPTAETMYNEFIENNPEQTVYYLTSSKILQQQIYHDIQRFSLSKMKMLKGTSSYWCLSEKAMIEKLLITPEEKKQRLLQATYTNRPCKNESQPLPETKYSECYKVCPYIIARGLAVEAQSAVLNYHYFLTVQNSAFKLFKPRKFTICDEAHKLNEIVDDMFTCQLNVHFVIDFERLVNKMHNMRYDLQFEVYNNPNLIINIKNKFATLSSNRDYLISFMNEYKEFADSCIEFLLKAEEVILKELAGHPEKTNVVEVLDRCRKLKETCTHQCEVLEYYSNALTERGKDIFLRVELPFQAKYYVFEIKDLNESYMLQQKFIKWTDRVLFMSATMGDMGEFADTFGLDHSKCCVVKIKSTFDYSTSPIYLCNAGNLRRKDFDKNIDKCLRTVVQIVKDHPNQKGLIHTHTFGINKALREMAYYDPELCNRLMFYETARDKEKIIDKMKKEPDNPIVICGPSLVEGIDLKYDLGRFNILIKTPYAPINDYVKAKMDYCSFWYRRMTKQTIIQSIGRTNRAKDDSSETYLIDSGFYDLVWELDDEIITPRIQEKKIILKDQPKPQPKQMAPIDLLADSLPEDPTEVKDYKSSVNYNDMSSFDQDLPF